MPEIGASRVTILDIAREAAVSKSTVSLVLRDAPGVGPEARERVREAMVRLGYVYHRGAARLRRGGGADTVGMIINDLTNPFFAELAVGIERALAGAGTVPFLANTGESPARQAQVMKAMREHGAAGFILCPALGTDAAFLGEVAGWRLPVVTVMRRVPGARASHVGPDNRTGAERAAAHLLALGHRRVAFLGGRRGMTVQEERVEGYARALVAAGLPRDDALVVESAPSRDGGAAALGQVLALPEPPTAALCFNDVVAFGVLQGLAARGLAPARDLAVVGFDDVADARHTVPPLTTVAVDPPGLGERAAAVLLRQVRDPAAGPVEHHGEARLVIRASCGGAAAVAATATNKEREGWRARLVGA
jgi:LacI family transcriptional regulator